MILLVQLLKTMQAIVPGLREAEQKHEVTRFNSLKKEALGIQKKIDSMQ